MRIIINKETGKIIESQSFATEGTLIKNAISAGFLAEHLEEKEISEIEYQAMIDLEPKPTVEPTAEELLEQRINDLELYILTQEGLI